MALIARTNYASVADDALDPLWAPDGRHTAGQGHIGAEQDPLGGSFRVQRHTVHNGDVLWGGDRCEVMTTKIGGVAGSRFQVGFGLLLPTDFQSSPSGWNSLWDFHYPNNGPAQSPLTVSIRNTTELWIRVFGGPLTPDGTMGTIRVERKVADLTKNRWHTLAWDILQTTDTSAFMDTYVDGKLVDHCQSPTLSPNCPNTTYWKQGFYRAANTGGTATYFYRDTVCVNGNISELLPLLGTTPPPLPPADPCATVKTNLAATEEALAEATSRIEQTRSLCHDQIVSWRTANPPRTWAWIKRQPAARAYYGPLEGS